MRPLPWSHTSLSDFVNCPRAFHEKRVVKSVKEEESPEMIWGRRVHEAFENRQSVRTPLPDELQVHEAYMQRLDAIPGTHWTEQKIALDLKARPCHFFSPDVWFRGIIDYKKVYEPDNRATVVDYKTGKPHSKFEQLALCALHTFAAHPIDVVDVQFYWTQTTLVTRKVYGRDEIPVLWKMFIPDLKQYKEAFDTDVWQPRQSGLCKGWCPVTTCEFWQPKRVK